VNAALPAKATKLKRAAKPKKPIYFKVEKLVRPGTGEEVGCLVPLSQWDAQAMRARKYKVGTQVRAVLTKPRNGWMLRITHALGALAVAYIEGFEEYGEDSHAAFKRLQRDCGLCCEESQLDLGPLGTVTVKTPQSIAYDEMEDQDFNALALGVCAYIRNKYAGVPPDELAEIITKIEAQNA
jgi:hypothetical protein